MQHIAPPCASCRSSLIMASLFYRNLFPGPNPMRACSSCHLISATLFLLHSTATLWAPTSMQHVPFTAFGYAIIGRACCSTSLECARLALDAHSQTLLAADLASSSTPSPSRPQLWSSTLMVIRLGKSPGSKAPRITLLHAAGCVRLPQWNRLRTPIPSPMHPQS